MLKAERTDKVFEIIKEKKYTTVAELVKRLCYSPATIRRDLTYLERLGLIVKSYGGVSINQMAKPVIIREHENTVDKIKLCKSASQFINDGDTVFIDGTTTTYFLNEYLLKKKNITVVTTNLKLAMFLGENNVKCFVTGGQVHDTIFLSGALSSELIKKMRIDVAFFSCGRVSGSGEVCVGEKFWDFMNVAINKSKKNVLLCDAQKIKEKFSMVFCDLGVFDVVITDGEFSEHVYKKFKNTEFIKV